MGALPSGMASRPPDQRALLERGLKVAGRPAPARAAAEPIAIVGMGCRFPGPAASPDAFWRLLKDGIDAISDIPANPWDVPPLYDPDPTPPPHIPTPWARPLEPLAQ